jgi:hypothetical protein
MVLDFLFAQRAFEKLEADSRSRPALVQLFLQALLMKDMSTFQLKARGVREGVGVANDAEIVR